MAEKISHDLRRRSESVARRFSDAGGIFLTSPDRLFQRLAHIQALVFDWDGVFNPGCKAGQLASGFSEADSMGINMLRYGLWLANAQLPVAAVISGADNPGAFHFARREHFHRVYTAIRDKRSALEHLYAACNLSPGQIACVFDDINDLAMARGCGLRLMIGRPASPLFSDFVARHRLADYISAHDPQRFALREITELLLGLMGRFEAVVQSRISWDPAYQRYFNQRQAVAPLFFTRRAGKIVPVPEPL